jgi:hypothetical protein
VLLLAAAGLVIGVLGYRLYHRGDHTLPDMAALPVPPVVSTPSVPSAAVPAVDTAPAPAASATAADFPVVPTEAPPAASAAAPSASGAPAAADSAAATPGSVEVTLTTVPPKGKFFHQGKEVGTAPFVVDLPAGEKRAYEVFLPGHITHKVVIDGSKTKISIGLREEPH